MVCTLSHGGERQQHPSNTYTQLRHPQIKVSTLSPGGERQQHPSTDPSYLGLKPVLILG